MNKFALVAIIGLVAISLVAADLPTGLRFVRTFNQGPAAYVASLDYEASPPPGKENNMFIFAMGHQFGQASKLPFAAISYAKNVGNGAGANPAAELGRTSVLARGVAFFFDSLHVYCETNGKPGWQLDEGQLPIATAASATWRNVVSWTDASNVTHMVLTETTDTFTLECRVGPEDRVEGGRVVGPYAAKCDIAVNMTGRWPELAAAIFCPDKSKQHAGIHSYVASVGYDSTTPSAPDAHNNRKLTFNGNAAAFAWQGMFKTSNDTDADVYAEVIDSRTGTSSAVASSKGIGWEIHSIGFSFLASRNDTDTFFWDPEFIFNSAPSRSVIGLLTLVVVALLF